MEETVQIFGKRQEEFVKEIFERQTVFNGKLRSRGKSSEFLAMGKGAR
jgi:hypothetical protein